MKKIITIIMLMFCVLSINAQVDSIYLSKGRFHQYHTNINCKKIKKITDKVKVSNINYKAFRTFKNCTYCTTELINDSITNFIKYKDIHTANLNTDKLDIWLAGNYQTKSATFRGITMGLMGAGAVTATIAATVDFGGSDTTTKSALFGVAGVFALSGIVTEIISIKYQYKSGNCLKIGAGKITYNF